KGRTVSSVLRGLDSRRPPYHQAGASHDAVIMRMHHAAIHSGAMAEIIGIYNQVSLGGHISQFQIVQQSCQHGLGLEIFFGNISGSAAVSLVIAFDRFESSQDLVHRVKGEQPLTCWEDRAEASVLSDNWPAGREVAGTAITEPSSLQAHVRILSHGKFAARRLQVIPVGTQIERMRIRQMPAV